MTVGLAMGLGATGKTPAFYNACKTTALSYTCYLNLITGSEYRNCYFVAYIYLGSGVLRCWSLEGWVLKCLVFWCLKLYFFNKSWSKTHCLKVRIFCFLGFLLLAIAQNNFILRNTHYDIGIGRDESNRNLLAGLRKPR